MFNTPISLPSKFEFELEFTQSASNNYITVMIGESSDNYYYHGFGNTKQLTMAISRNNNRAVLVNDDSYMNVVTDSVKVGYDGTSMYVTANNRTVTSNNSEFSLDKFLGLLWGGSSTIHSIAINKL